MHEDEWNSVDPTRSKLRALATPLSLRRPASSSGRVLCALDVSAKSRGALLVASSLAQRFSASLDGLHAVAIAQSWQSRVERVKRLIAEHNAREQLNALLAPLAPSLPVESFVARGPASEVILAHAWQHEADLIVLGSAPGAAGSRRHVVDSVAARAGCAVLTVPDGSRAEAPKRILLPVTLNDVPDAALGWAALLGNTFGSRVTVMPVRAPRRGFWPLRSVSDGFNARSSSEQHLNGSVERVLVRLRAAGLRHVERAPSAAAVSDFGDPALSAQHDLVLVGTPRLPFPCTEDEILSRLRRKAILPALSVRGFTQPAAAKSLPVPNGYSAQRASA